MGDKGPIFLAGIDRSGIGFLCELLESHPNIAMTRRTNFWSFYFRRFGDLKYPENVNRCLEAMTRYSRLQDLQPQPERIRREFQNGEPTYARLFALIEQHNAERLGKPRWGDKSLNAEGHAVVILGAYPSARMVHVIRDPRDRYASALKHRKLGRGGAGAGTALWLWSARLAKLNLRRYPDRYMVVRYETLVAQPEATLRAVCRFLGEEYSPAMLAANKGSPHGSDGERQRPIWTTSVGKFRDVLLDRDIAFMQMCAWREMSEFRYHPVPLHFSLAGGLRFYLADFPTHLALMAGSRAKLAVRNAMGRTPSARRIASGQNSGTEASAY